MTKGLKRTSRITLVVSLDCPNCELKPFSVSVIKGSPITDVLTKSLPAGFSCMVTKGHSARLQVQQLSDLQKSPLDRWCAVTPTELASLTRMGRIRARWTGTYGDWRQAI